MVQPHRKSPETPGTSRRVFLLGGITGVAALAGCLDVSPDDGGPQERTFDVTITASNGELSGTVAEADVEDVVRVHVGDTVTFTFANETDGPVGVHDHASDADVVIPPADDETIAFEVTEAMIGRQEIEAWFADAGAQSDDDHGADATPIVIVEVRPRGS